MKEKVIWPTLPLKKVIVPEGTRGAWTVKRFDVGVDDAERFNMRERIGAMQGHGVPREIRPGRYTGLYNGASDPVMSDTPAEMRDHAEFVRRAEGRVLIAGLGLGLCVHNLLLKRSVKSVTVVEIDPDVAFLVAPHYLCRDTRFHYELANAEDWKPKKGDRFDFAWLDIWPSICGDHVPQIKKMVKRYRRFADSVDVWCYREQLRANLY